jgi:hypothetical protein
MRRTSILVLGATLLVALGLVAAGCGGGSKNSAATEAATTEVATTEAVTTEETTEAATTEEATTEEQTTTAAPNLSGLATSKNCRDLVGASSKFSSAFSGAANSQDLKKQAQLFQEFASKTPEDIRPDFKVVADFLSKIAEVYGTIKPGTTPDPATIAKLQSLSTKIDQTKLTQASQHISAWLQKNCKT